MIKHTNQTESKFNPNTYSNSNNITNSINKNNNEHDPYRINKYQASS